MEHSQTVIEAKSRFLRRQIRLLSATLQPSSQWRDSAPETDADLSDKVLEDVLEKVNAKLKQHNRLVYSSESSRHVAEQIDVLYWNSMVKANAGGEDLESDSTLAIKKEADLTSTETIQSLPKSLEKLAPSTNSATQYTQDDVQDYSAIQKRLTDLAARRADAQTRLTQLQALKKLLAPFEDPQTNVQPNLVTRNGELGKELDRMRILLARATSAIQQSAEKKSPNGVNGDVDMLDDSTVDSQKHQLQTERGKLEAIMDLT